MKKFLAVICALVLCSSLTFSRTIPTSTVTLRPPAVPLVTNDPFLSCWSMADRLYDDSTRHWTTRPHSMCGLIRIDGNTKRFMGTTPEDIEVIEQIALDVFATRSVYTFADNTIELRVTFLSPLLLDDLKLLSRPVSYVQFEVRSIDDKNHDVQIYFDAAGQWAVNNPDQQVQWKRLDTPSQLTMAIGTTSQRILASKGDDHRIDWGYLLVSVPDTSAKTYMGDLTRSQRLFKENKPLPDSDDTSMPRKANDRLPGLSVQMNLGSVGSGSKQKFLIIGYDDIYSIQYFHRPLRGFWRKDPAVTTESMLKDAAVQFKDILDRCEKFDKKLYSDAVKVGGKTYADLCTIVYRQAIAAHKLVADVDGKPLFFSKENNSNGSIGTVDVTYPSTPLFLIYNAELVKGMLEPIFYYRESGQWTKPIAAHDVGTYPIANGQTYGADMPVEECGNMIILTAAIAMVEGSPDYARIHWKTLTEWVEYLQEHGFDPVNQLCTDDFAGHLARNANLSIKAITAIGCYAKLASHLGHKDVAEKYTSMAREMALKWIEMAKDDDHYSLTFDQKGTWSQKYNLAWDRILGLNLFPDFVRQKEIAYYLKVQNEFGLPLDSRRTFTKSDWILWTATLTDSRDEFEKLIAPVWKYVNECKRRIPVGDWHETTDGRHINMYARSVVGGYYMKMLADPFTQKKSTTSFDWKSYVAPIPPVLHTLVPASDTEPQTWRYTFEKPAADWFKKDFDDSKWQLGTGHFCNENTPNAKPSTLWNTSDIWLRRSFDLESVPENLRLWIRHDEDAQVYINGILAVELTNWTDNYISIPVSEAAVDSLKKGPNTFAVHCSQTTGGQYIGLGLIELR